MPLPPRKMAHPLQARGCHPQQAARGVLQLPAQGQPGPRPQISGTRLSASTFPFFGIFILVHNTRGPAEHDSQLPLCIFA